MNKIIKIVLLTFFLSFYSEAYSQYGEYADYFPLKVGNKYIYKVSGSYGYNFIINASIDSSKVINDHLYYYCKDFPGEFKNQWVRFDTTNGNIYVLGSGYFCDIYYNEKRLDSFHVNVGDTIEYCYVVPTQTELKICNDKGTTSLFGLNNNFISFKKTSYILQFIFEKNYKFFKTIGLYNFSAFTTGMHGSSHIEKLLGCVINGVVYGDTSLTNITLLGNEIPDKFSLFQNFPNPFNPVTNIKYQLSMYSEVKLGVYNITGETIEVLVNQNQDPGLYQYTFDAAGLSSGIYFYTIQIKFAGGNYTDTKKMLLIK
jgi:hypothetical protein